MPKRRNYVIEIEAEDRTSWQGMSADGLKRYLEQKLDDYQMRIYSVDVKEVD